MISQRIFAGWFVLLALLATPALRAEEPGNAGATTYAEVNARLKPFAGHRALNGVDPSSLDGKIMCGYQGWFFVPGDGSGNSWVHWGPGKFGPGYSTVDMWPDMTELGRDEQFASGFRYSDGTSATVFSSYLPKTVDRHFKWMAEYGIDGVFAGRFGTTLRNPKTAFDQNVVLENIRNAANANGRTWCVSYDLSGMKAEEVPALIIADWKALVDRMKIRSDPGYQRHNGKPLVEVWGVGFQNRPYTTQACGELVDFLKNDPQYGGNAVMVGVPRVWRPQAGVPQPDPNLLSVLKRADIVNPWSVGRYGTVPQFQSMLRSTGQGDIAWCQENHLAYMPVIFPGTSWVNLRTFRGKEVGPPIGRDHGNFFWKQGVGWVDSGARMLFVAMFDEVDEGTAIFKVTNHPPVSEQNAFVSLDGDPTDLYLWLTGKLGALLKRTEPVTQQMPQRDGAGLRY